MINAKNNIIKKYIFNIKINLNNEYFYKFKGTGKSFLIETIVEQIKFLYSNELTNPDDWLVAVLAPTGMAAFNIKGLTIHRFFKIPVQHTSSKKFWNLSPEDLKQIRMVTKNLKLIIIGINITITFQLKYIIKI